MKLIISSSELLKGVMAVSKAIPAKSPLPILENFLFWCYCCSFAPLPLSHSIGIYFLRRVGGVVLR